MTLRGYFEKNFKTKCGCKLFDQARLVLLTNPADRMQATYTHSRLYNYYSYYCCWWI